MAWSMHRRLDADGQSVPGDATESRWTQSNRSFLTRTSRPLWPNLRMRSALSETSILPSIAHSVINVATWHFYLLLPRHLHIGFFCRNVTAVRSLQSGSAFPPAKRQTKERKCDGLIPRRNCGDSGGDCRPRMGQLLDTAKVRKAACWRLVSTYLGRFQLQ